MSKDRGVRAVFDAESNGFLYDSTQIHCICIYDLDSRETFDYNVDDRNIKQGLEHLDSFQLGIGHNICGFDIPLFYRLYGWESRFSPRDTLCMSKLFFPEQPDHSLEYYGKRFKRYKPPITDYSKFTPELLHRCKEDVEINVMTYEYFIMKELSKWKWLDSLKLEQQFVYDQAMQELIGVDIDEKLAYEVVDEIDLELSKLDPLILSQLPLRIVEAGICSKPFLKNGDLCKAAEEWFS